MERINISITSESTKCLHEQKLILKYADFMKLKIEDPVHFPSFQYFIKILLNYAEGTSQEYIQAMKVREWKLAELRIKG